MNIITSKLKILKKLQLETLPGFTNKYYYKYNYFFKEDLIIKCLYLSFIKYNNILFNMKLKYLYTLKTSYWGCRNNFYKFKIISNLNFKLDIIFIKLGMFTTIKQAKQFIKHKNILINSNLVTSINFILRVKDIIQLNILNNNNKLKILEFNIIQYKILSEFFYKVFKVMMIININTFIIYVYNNNLCRDFIFIK